MLEDEVSNIRLTKGQEQALGMVKALVKHDQAAYGILCGYAGCHRKGQAIMKYDGTLSAVEELRVGDRLMGPDSTPRTIEELKRGFGEMVEVVPAKGAPFVVNIDHILVVQMVAPYHVEPGRGRRQRAATTSGPGAVLDVSVREWLRWPRTKQLASKLLRVGVAFQKRTTPPLDPYLLGLLLGDGLMRGSVGVTNISPEVLGFCKQAAETYGLRFIPAGKGSNEITHMFYGARCGKGKTNQLINQLREVGVFGKVAGDKSVPEVYRTGSSETRLRLLAGLMDTDGSVSDGGFDYTTKSPKLADDICFIARSLGLAAYQKPCKKFCQTGGGGIYHRVFISGDCSVIPTLHRHAPIRKQRKNVLRTGFKVRRLGCEDFYGFSLDGDGRFLLDDFTVTHNTGKSTLLKCVAKELGSPIVLTPTGKAAIRVREAAGLEASTIHRYLYKVVEDSKTGYVSWVRKELLEIHRPGNGLIVIDEASMVGDKIWRDLWEVAQALEIKILLVGDLFQLPPVNPEDADFSTLTSLSTPFRANLTEVVRQALDNPIIEASMLIRQSEFDTLDAIDLLPSIESQNLVRDHVKLPTSKALIVWRNATRRRLNSEIRLELGLAPDILNVGEQLIVTYNNYDLDRYNGEIVTFNGWTQAPGEQEAVTDRFKGQSAMIGYGVTTVEGKVVLLSPEEVLGRAAGMSAKTIAGASRGYGRRVLGYPAKTAPPHLNADLGYALTAHKSQGSEYDNVVVLIEKGRRVQMYEGRRWLYTSITRAKSSTYLCFEE